jgi:hypothetical protein
MAALLLIGFSVVYTMAFELNSPTVEAPEAYAVSDSGTAATVDSVKIRPSKGGDRMIITLGLSNMTAASDYAIGIELTDDAGTDGYYDLSSPTAVSPAANGNEDYAAGYYETTYSATGATGTLIIKLDKASIWVDVDGIMILVSDA